MMNPTKYLPKRCPSVAHSANLFTCSGKKMLNITVKKYAKGREGANAFSCVPGTGGTEGRGAARVENVMRMFCYVF